MSNQSCYKAITDFVSDLGEFFSTENHALALYDRLLSKTNLSHTEAVEKHIQSFKKFLSENETNIVEGKTTFEGNITYSPKVYLDLNAILKCEMDPETKDAIFNHLLTLCLILNGSVKAKEVIKEKHAERNKALTISATGDGEEDDFLNNIISKVEKHVSSDTKNPEEAISSIMSSGMIPELVSSLNSGISSGKLDLAKMMTSVQKMVGSIAPEAQSDPNLANAMGMLSNMMNVMNLPK